MTLKLAGPWPAFRSSGSRSPAYGPRCVSIFLPGERANAQLKSWRILRKLRCCPWRGGQLAKAVHVLRTPEIGGWKTLNISVPCGREGGM
jgi:hypothetical protein